jgi:hypothetical protein
VARGVEFLGRIERRLRAEGGFGDFLKNLRFPNFESFGAKIRFFFGYYALINFRSEFHDHLLLYRRGNIFKESAGIHLFPRQDAVRDHNNLPEFFVEQALLVIRQLGMGADAAEQLFRRMVFNIVARNPDDHVKNISFLMDQSGAWSLSPAFDLTYNCQPTGEWTSSHQMTLKGKRAGFQSEDFRACARTASLKRGRADAITEEILDWG